MKRTLTIDYSDEVLLALGCSPEQFSEEAKLLVAVKLYELGRLSSGVAAKLADIPKPLFLMKLADYGVDTFQLTPTGLGQCPTSSVILLLSSSTYTKPTCWNVDDSLTYSKILRYIPSVQNSRP